MRFRYHRKRIDRFASTHPHYPFDAFSTVHTKALSTQMRFQKYAFSLSSKTHRSIRVHTTFLMRFWLSTLRSYLYLFGFKSMRFRCHRKRIDRFAFTLPFGCVFDCPHWGPVCTYLVSKVCVFVVIENASIDSHPYYRFDAFSTLHTKALSLMRFQKYAFSLLRKRIDRFASTLMPGFH